MHFLKKKILMSYFFLLSKIHFDFCKVAYQHTSRSIFFMRESTILFLFFPKKHIPFHFCEDAYPMLVWSRIILLPLIFFFKAALTPPTKSYIYISTFLKIHIWPSFRSCLCTCTPSYPINTPNPVPSILVMTKHSSPLASIIFIINCTPHYPSADPEGGPGSGTPPPSLRLVRDGVLCVEVWWVGEGSNCCFYLIIINFFLARFARHYYTNL